MRRYPSNFLYLWRAGSQLSRVQGLSVIMTVKKERQSPKDGDHKLNSEDPLGANSEIARSLKRYYSSLVTEEVPDRFAQLLSELDSAETPPKDG
jgi:hypothetical protein